MTAAVTPEREAEIRAMAWKTGREIDLAHALARMTLALRDALSLLDQVREERDEALARSTACEACAAELAEARAARDEAKADRFAGALRGLR